MRFVAVCWSYFESYKHAEVLRPMPCAAGSLAFRQISQDYLH
jgi:hypothetical protein